MKIWIHLTKPVIQIEYTTKWFLHTERIEKTRMARINQLSLKNDVERSFATKTKALLLLLSWQPLLPKIRQLQYHQEGRGTKTREQGRVQHAFSCTREKSSAWMVRHCRIISTGFFSEKRKEGGRGSNIVGSGFGRNKGWIWIFGV